MRQLLNCQLPMPTPPPPALLRLLLFQSPMPGPPPPALLLLFLPQMPTPPVPVLQLRIMTRFTTSKEGLLLLNQHLVRFCGNFCPLVTKVAWTVMRMVKDHSLTVATPRMSL